VDCHGTRTAQLTSLIAVEQEYVVQATTLVMECFHDL